MLSCVVMATAMAIMPGTVGIKPVALTVGMAGMVDMSGMVDRAGTGTDLLVGGVANKSNDHGNDTCGRLIWARHRPGVNELASSGSA